MKKILFTKASEDFRKLFVDQVKKANSICITSHTSPDDDSISSVLSVYNYLTKYLGVAERKVEILYTGERDDKWEYFEDFRRVKFVRDIFHSIDGKDLVILLDGSYWNRFSREEKISKYKGEVICIDHHPIDEPQFHYHLNMSEATSTAEMVYRLFFAKAKLDKKICEIILLGILGDTGNFKFVDADKSEILLIAQRLIKEGNINVESFENAYSKIGLDVYRGLSELITNSEIKEIKGWPRFLYSYVSSEFAVKNNLTDGQLSESAKVFAPYLKGIIGVTWGMVFTPRSHDNTFSLSLRSEPGTVAVRRLAEGMKIGGGHDRAAGGKLKTYDVGEASEMVFSWMKKNEPVLS